jgi:hypothetical protein
MQQGCSKRETKNASPPSRSATIANVESDLQFIVVFPMAEGTNEDQPAQREYLTEKEVTQLCDAARVQAEMAAFRRLKRKKSRARRGVPRNVFQTATTLGFTQFASVNFTARTPFQFRRPCE